MNILPNLAALFLLQDQNGGILISIRIQSRWLVDRGRNGVSVHPPGTRRLLWERRSGMVGAQAHRLSRCQVSLTEPECKCARYTHVHLFFLECTSETRKPRARVEHIPKGRGPSHPQHIFISYHKPSRWSSLC